MTSPSLHWQSCVSHPPRRRPAADGVLSRLYALRRGIAVTELAIGLPIVLLVGMETIEMCTMIRLRQKLKMVAYEGARVGVLPSAQASNVNWQCGVLCTDQSIKNTTVTAFSQYLTDSPQREKLSLSTYSGSSSTEQKLTYDYNKILNGLDGYSQSFTGGAAARTFMPTTRPSLLLRFKTSPADSLR